MTVKLIIHLGPRLVSADGKVLGTTDDLSLEIVETTAEEISQLKSAYSIRLVKIPGKTTGENKEEVIVENNRSIDQVHKKV